MIESETYAPDLEDLAAYIDGKLSGERKAKVEERLLRDEDYYEVFQESLAFAEEQDKEPRLESLAESATDGDPEALSGSFLESNVTRRQDRRLLATGLLAAGLTGLVLLATLLVQKDLLSPGLGEGPTAVTGPVAANESFLGRVMALIKNARWGQPSTEERLAELDAKKILATPEWDDPLWSRFRGLGTANFNPSELAFRLGARNVSLDVALASQDSEQVRQQLEGLQIRSGEASRLLGLSIQYQLLLNNLETSDLASIRSGVKEIEESLLDIYEQSDSLAAEGYALGKWMQAGRMAALARDGEVLQGLIEDRPSAKNSPRVEQQFATLDLLAQVPELTDANFETALDALQKIAYELAG